MIGGDSKVVRVLVKEKEKEQEKERLLSLIQGRLDIGYEILNENTGEMASFLLMKDLIALKPKVVKDELQRPTESIQYLLV